MKTQRGAAVVEFALVLSILLLLCLGLLELGRALFTWNSASEATRRGARMAAIVAIDQRDLVLTEMQRVMPNNLEDADVIIRYSVDGINFPDSAPNRAACARGTCRFVRVSISRTYYPLWFLLPRGMSIPPVETTIPVEALGVT